MIDLTQLLPLELKLDILGLVEHDKLLDCSLLSQDWRAAARSDNRFLFTCWATLKLNRRAADIGLQRVHEIVQTARMTGTGLRFCLHARDAPPGSLGFTASTALNARLGALCDVLVDSMKHILVLDVQSSPSLATPVFEALRTSAPNLLQLRIKNLGPYCTPAVEASLQVKKALELPWGLLSGSAPALRVLALSNVAIGSTLQSAFTHVRVAYIQYASLQDGVHEDVSPNFPALHHIKATIVQPIFLTPWEVRQHVNLIGLRNIGSLDLDCSDSSVEKHYDLCPNLLSTVPRIRFRNMRQKD